MVGALLRGAKPMNAITSVEKAPEKSEAEQALATLRAWAAGATSDEIADLDPAVTRLLTDDEAYPEFNRVYPQDFAVSTAYKQSLPDLQNGPSSLIRGAKQQIQHVGISSLEADKKGINMSRIMRSFYKHAERTFSFDVIEAALDDYKSDLESMDARILMRFSFPMKIESLRSGLSGYQYYDVALELVEKDGVRQKMIHLDYVYSSTCPCSLELSEHARATRGQLATPHSQRSVARISAVIDCDESCLWFEDLIDACRRAVPTETQVMVKREDEQAFAELNAANPIFVEDAARLFCEQLQAETRVGDFRIIASHQESLHSHDAISILTQGPTFEADSIDPKLFNTLFHVG